MRRIHQSILIICIIVILSTPSHAKKSKTCPLGFNLAESHYKDIDHVCYKRKDLESFAETLKECDGNLYTSKLYRNLNIAQLDYSDYLWSEYKTFYPGGPYVSWSIAEHEWSIQEDVYNYNPPLQYDLDQNLCLVFNKHGNYSTVNCDEQFYRYCLVEPYPERKDLSRKGCEDLRGSWRVGNLKEMCLFDVRGVGGGTVRATWNQSRSLCAKHGGSLLSKGWQHASMGAFQTSGISPIYPLGIIWDHESRSLQYVSESEDISVEEPFETFGSSLNATIETMYMAIQDETWFPVNNTYLFFDVICERPVRPRQISLQLTINADNKMILEVNGEVDKDDIHCTTDSESYKPTKVKIHHDDDKDIYILSPATDGSYWCTHVDRYNYKETNSGVVLFTRERASLVNLYAVKIRVNNWYKFDEADDLKDDWKEKLEEYIFYRTKYVQMYDYKDLNPINVENILRSFQKTMIGLNWRSGDAIYKIRVKRLYMDRLTVLLHVELNPEMIPVTPGTWGDLEVLFMKPAYYCKGFDSIPRQSIGESTYAPNCRTFTCVGDFNEGVQWVETGTPGCIATTSVPMEKSISIKDDVTYRMPTIPPTTILTREQSSISLETEDVDHQDLKNDDSLLAPVNSTAGYNVTERMTDDSDDSDESGESTTIITTANYPITENYVPTHIRPPTLPTTTTIEPVLTSTLPTTLAPDLQLEQVLHDLEQLLEDTTAEITIDRVDPAFDLVNEIFGGAGNNLEIPSDLLHMLDELGSRMYLNGSTRAATIRTNVALLVADAAPENPIRGIRVAVENQTVDTFTENSFEFIDELNSTQLAANQSAAVVYLPESVTTSEHRVSFVIFRNERAFRPQEGVQVNSHVISVNVENTTTFESGDCQCGDEKSDNSKKCVLSLCTLKARKARSAVRPRNHIDFSDYYSYEDHLTDKDFEDMESFSSRELTEATTKPGDVFTDPIQRPRSERPDWLQHPSTKPMNNSEYVTQVTTTKEVNTLPVPTQRDRGRQPDWQMRSTQPMNNLEYVTETTTTTENVSELENITQESNEGQNNTINGDQRLYPQFMYIETTSLPSNIADVGVEVIDAGSGDNTTDQDIQEEDILVDIDDFLKNDTAIPIDTLIEALDKVDILLESGTNVTGKLLQKLDLLGSNVDLGESHQMTLVRDNIAIVVADATPSNPMRGLRITTDRSDAFNQDCFDFITGDDYSQYIASNQSDVVVALPASLMESSHRVSFVVFRDDGPFRYSSGSQKAIVNSRVLSVSVKNVTHIENGDVINIYLRPTVENPGRSMRRACAYWKFLPDGTGFWSQDGCTFVKSGVSGVLDSCQCDHLTYFAEVLIYIPSFSRRNIIILEILSVSGCMLSLLGLLLVVVTAVTFRSWRKEFSNKIRLQLSMAIMILNISFLIVNFSNFNEDISCVILGIALHYSVLVAFFWMLVSAINAYRNLVLIFIRDSSRKLLKFSIFAWGTPCVIIGILLAVNSQSYSTRFEETSPTGAFCYPSGISLWITVHLPLSLILLINWSIFLAILRSIWASKEIRSTRDTNDVFRSAAVGSVLVFIFGLPWIFGLFAYNIVVAYIFTITVSLQGFALFIFFVLGNKKTRELWMKMLRLHEKSSPDTPDVTWLTSARVSGSNRVSEDNRVSRGNRGQISECSISNLPPSMETVPLRTLFEDSYSLLPEGRVKVLPPFLRPDCYYE